MASSSWKNGHMAATALFLVYGLVGQAWAGPPFSVKGLMSGNVFVGGSGGGFQTFAPLGGNSQKTFGAALATPSNWWESPLGQTVSGGIQGWLTAASDCGHTCCSAGDDCFSDTDLYDETSVSSLPSNATAPANVLPTNPLPETGPAPRIAIVNPLDTGIPVQFLVDGRLGRLEPGQRLEIGQLRPKLIEFHRGGSFGPAKYRLREAVYTFQGTAGGLELYQRDYTPMDAE